MCKRVYAGLLTLSELRSVITTPSPILEIDLHPTEANLLVSAHKDGRCRVWDLEQKSCKFTSDPESDWVSTVRWVPGTELRLMAVVYTGAICCWSLASGVLRSRFKLNPQEAMELLAPVDEAWQANNWGDWNSEAELEKPATSPPEPPPPVRMPYTNLPFHSANGAPYQTSLIISPDGTLAAVGGQDGLSRLLDIDQGTFLYSLRTKAIIRTAQFSPIRFWDCIGTDIGWVIFDLETKCAVQDQQVEITAGQKTPPVPCLTSAWSREGQRFYVGYSDGMVRYWDVAE